MLVINHPNEAINAFSIAQIVSAVILCCCYYGFFYWYIPVLNGIKSQSNDKEKEAKKTIFSDMGDFPFNSVWDFFPGIMDNEVTYFYEMNQKFTFNILKGFANATTDINFEEC